MEQPNDPSRATGGPGLLAVKLLMLGLPLLLILAIYVADDPFRVIRRPEFGNYYDDQVYELNRDYASTEMFFSRHPTTKYDTFIFGSSRSFSYYCDDLQSYLPGSRPFHYPAASENLYGIYCKIKKLDESGVDLKNVLIVIDGWAMADLTSRTDHLHILHPRVSGDGWFNFQLAFVKAFLSRQFLFYYLDYRIWGQMRPWMREIFIEKGRVRIGPATNDFYFEREERQLREDEDAFYERRRHLFDAADSPRPRSAEPVLKADHEWYLREIEAIFRRHRTNFRIVISPLYDQPELHPKDCEILERIFGKSNVCNFSGVREITENRRNYYDPGHYRPSIARMIMRRAFLGPVSGSTEK
jgi:hypothetical protein